MSIILLSKSTTPIIGWIAQLLGWMMNGIYIALDAMGIPNVGLAIIFYTVIVYLLMTPLQIRQQKSSKMMSVVNPEIQKIQEKYKGRTDQDSRMKMQEETMAVYEKYGVSMSGSCVTLLIQLPLLFALYQVIYKIPGYITSIKNTLGALADKIMMVDGYTGTIKKFLEESSVRITLSGKTFSRNNVIDFLYLLKPKQWDLLSSSDYFSSLSSDITSVKHYSEQINQFAGINISESPWDVIRNGISSHAWLLVFAAILVPVLAWFTQWLNYKLMPQAGLDNNGNDNSTTGATMRSMNTFMPIFSAFLCVTLSMGIGIYWISGAVIRCIQQVVINRRIAKMDAETLIEQAKEKQKKKKMKKGNISTGNEISSAARQNLRRLPVQEPKYKDLDKKEVDYAGNAVNADPRSITYRANLVAMYDEKQAEKKKNRNNHSGKNNNGSHSSRNRNNRRNRPNGTSAKTSDNRTEKAPEKVSENLSDGNPEKASENLSDKNPAKAPENQTAGNVAAETGQAGPDNQPEKK